MYHSTAGMMKLRKRRLLKIVLLLLLLSVVPYIIVSSIEFPGVMERSKFYIDTIAVKSTDQTMNESMATQQQPPHYSIPSQQGDRGDNRSFPSLPPYATSDLLSTSRYCNSPFRAVSGMDGLPKKGFKLRQVHVFIRHGDRTPIHALPGIRVSEFNCNFKQWYNGSNVKFKQFVEHMAAYTGKQQRKSHFLNWALYPNKQKCDSSDLTSLGALQQLQNGDFLSHRYFGHESLFSKRLAVTSQIYVRSTAMSRTYQSAIAFMYGFVPGFNVTQLNIDHSANKYLCSTESRMVLSCSCSYLTVLEQRAKKYKSANHANSSEYSQIKSEFAKVLSLNENSSRVPWLSAIIDAVVPSLCHNLIRECTGLNEDTSIRSSNSLFMHQRCIKSELLERMWREYARSQAVSLEDPERNYQKYLNVQAHPVAMEMANRMRDLTLGRYVPKFVLYSGHDFTINAFLELLGVNNNSWPPYASRFNFELFERKGKYKSTFYFKVLYNGRDVTDEVVFCKSGKNRGLCEFRHLADFLFGRMLRQYGYTSHSDACSRKL